MGSPSMSWEAWNKENLPRKEPHVLHYKCSSNLLFNYREPRSGSGSEIRISGWIRIRNPDPEKSGSLTSLVGTGKTFNLPLSMILRIGYGFWEEFGNVGEEWICIRYSICPGAIAWGDHLASKSWHPTDNQPAFGRRKLFPRAKFQETFLL